MSAEQNIDIIRMAQRLERRLADLGALGRAWVNMPAACVGPTG
ncbi:hypothetical protein [Deinococcus radiophilus]